MFDSLKDFFGDIKNRVYSPGVSAFIFSFVIINYNKFILLIWGTPSIENRLKEFQFSISDSDLIWLPLISAIGYLFLSPLLGLICNIWAVLVGSWTKSLKIFFIKQYAMPSQDVARLVDEYLTEQKEMDKLVAESKKFKLESTNQISRLTSELAECRRQLMDLRTESTNKHNENVDLQNKVNGSQSRIVALENQLRHFENESRPSELTEGISDQILKEMLSHYDSAGSPSIATERLFKIIKSNFVSMNIDIKQSDFDLAILHLNKLKLLTSPSHSQLKLTTSGINKAKISINI